MMEHYEENGSLHEMFRKQVLKTPDNVAIETSDGVQMTYRELDDITEVLSSWLLLRGVAVDTIVGIYMKRCIEYTIAYIAILKAGGAYMPMDPTYPQSLLEDILIDAQPVAILTQHDLAKNMQDAKNVLVFDDGWEERIKSEVNICSVLPIPPSVSLDNLAYTVYSSGTTGKPKGIQCPHRGAVFSYTWRAEAYPYIEGEREACNVFFVWEMLRPLLRGATMCIIPDNTIYDPHLLCGYIQKHQITRMLFTPSLLEAVLDTDELDVTNLLKSIRTLIFCGEVVTVGLLERCMKTLGHVQFLNLYSISEAHDVACADLTQWHHTEQSNIASKKFCPVGQLLPGVYVVILDETLQPQPVGIAGEIYIGGPTLARGYLNRPELNNQRFIQCPPGVSTKFGDRLYKAGDWGYMLSDGSFEICGRCDSMVKIRGYSIEVQAVEAALLDLVLVNTCVVLSIGKEGEDKQLVAYVVPEGKATKKDIRSALKKRLPFYMIPAHFVFLSSIPILASSGKLDKKALPEISHGENTEDEESLPSTDTERRLEPLWAQALQMKHVDVHESFFDLGGHSLLAAKLLTKVKETFNFELSVKDLFIYSTVSSMAKLLDESNNPSSTEGRRMSIVPELDLLREVNTHDVAVLDMDIQLRAFWRSMRVIGKWHTGRVLLTGATGFLGVFLLKDLIQNTRSHIFCIVRELPDKTGLERIRATMVEYGMLDADSSRSTEEKQLLEAKLGSRVTIFTGDVGLLNMGLSEEDYMYLCTEIDYIIHAAAAVNLIYPYKALYGPNVLGTQNVVKFACTNKIKPVHYISTDAVFPHGMSDCCEDADMTQFANRLEDGYSQTKWVAERLVHRAMERGLPAVIYRLGNLSGETNEAFWNGQDFNLLMIKGCVTLNSAPDVDWDIEMTPVNFVSNLVVTLVQNMALALGKVFHVTNAEPLKASWLFDWMSAHGYPVNVIPFEDWKNKVETEKDRINDRALLARLLDTMIRDESYFSKLSSYKQDTLASVLKTLDLSYPKINHQLLETYFHNLVKRGILSRSHKSKLMDRPLEGRVAIVTGSSSGIGAAIARQLAKSGALVAMAARREDKLDDLKKTIQADGGVAIAVKCDVTNREQVQNLVSHTECTLGPVDILVNNAGVMYYTMMKNLQEEEWDKQVDINCKGVLNCIGAVLDGMLKRGKGHIVNMSSDAGRRGFAGLAVYSGTKFFVEGLSQGMRIELANTGIKVTCIQPGDVKTELLAHTTDQEAKDSFAAGSDVKVLQPDDIANAVIYATTQPPYTAINEILIEPREAPI